MISNSSSSAAIQPWGHPPLDAVVTNGAGHIVDASHPSAVPADFHSDQKLSTTLPHTRSKVPPVIDLTNTNSHDHDFHDNNINREPPAKRLRLDPIVGNSSSPAGGDLKINSPSVTPKPASMTWRNRPAWSFQALVSEASAKDHHGEDSTAEEVESPPPLPDVPWRFTPPDSPRSGDGDESKSSTPIGEVQTTPYHIEPPAAAPTLKGNSKTFTLF